MVASKPETACFNARSSSQVQGQNWSDIVSASHGCWIGVLDFYIQESTNNRTNVS